MQGGPNTGVGDLTVYDFLLFQACGTTLGAGPLIAAPTAKGDAYGSGKWQAGAAGIVIAPHNWGLLAVLATYQHSFSGNSSSPIGQLTSVQPFFIDNFPHGFYFRSTGVWTFDTFHHVQNIPLGSGVGKVWTSSHGDIANLYIEPHTPSTKAVLDRPNGRSTPALHLSSRWRSDRRSGTEHWRCRLTESLEVIQKTSAVILAAIEDPAAETAEEPEPELAQAS